MLFYGKILELDSRSKSGMTKEMFEKIPTKNRIFLGAFVAMSIILTLLVISKINKDAQKIIEEQKKIQDEAEFEIIELKYDKMMEAREASLPIEPLFNPPPPPDIERMKREGCIVDGLLNGYNKGTESAIKLVNRSNCYYLHRAIETWLEPPDFEEIEKTMAKIKKEDVVYGMFIAEAIDTKADYRYEYRNRDFDFSKMCRSGSKNDWGEHTCKPILSKKEYQRYVKYITRKAMDLGVQSFMFGQIYYQDYISDPSVKEVIDSMRSYANLRGLEIVIGAQTNDIEDEKYLKQFDFIEGGVGINSEGKIEEGSCFSRWYKKPGDWCWALLWHERFSSKAKNVFVHLDWSGIKGDDMSIFANMSREKRAETLRYLDNYFEKTDVGFLMPMIAVLHKENGGCYGRTKRYYSADNKYSCKDEDVINKLLK